MSQTTFVGGLRRLRFFSKPISFRVLDHFILPLAHWPEVGGKECLQEKGVVGLFRSFGSIPLFVVRVPAVQSNSKHQTRISSGSSQQKPQGSVESLWVNKSDKNQPEHHKKFFGMFLSTKWGPVKKQEQRSPAETREVLHGVAMQEQPLAVYGVPFVLLPNHVSSQTSAPGKHHMLSHVSASPKYPFTRHLPEKVTRHNRVSKETRHFHFGP